MNLLEFDERVDIEKASTGRFAHVPLVWKGGYAWNEDLVYEGDTFPFVSVDYEDVSEPPWLIPKQTENYGFTYPLLTRWLHRQFASIRPTPERINGFANEFGLLGHGLELRDLSAKARSKRDYESLKLEGEPMAFWIREIERMKELIELWQYVKDEREDILRNSIKWELSENTGAWRWKYKKDTTKRVAYDFDDWYEWSGPRDADDVFGLTRHYVQRQVSKAMQWHVSPKLIYRGGRSHLLMSADCLRSAMYVLFAQEMQAYDSTTDKIRGTFEACKRCGTIFLREHGNKEYCTRQCSRSGTYYRGKEKKGGADRRKQTGKKKRANGNNT